MTGAACFIFFYFCHLRIKAPMRFPYKTSGIFNTRTNISWKVRAHVADRGNESSLFSSNTNSNRLINGTCSNCFKLISTIPKLNYYYHQSYYCTVFHRITSGIFLPLREVIILNTVDTIDCFFFLPRRAMTSLFFFLHKIKNVKR
jgi:hypothetical protein